jgi:hypothetical protein
LIASEQAAHFMFLGVGHYMQSSAIECVMLLT